MIYLDHGATSFPKLPQVRQAVLKAMERCANPGRGGYPAAMEAAQKVFECREAAAQLFDCQPEQVVLTSSCTHGLNLAIRSLLRPGDGVVISGFEHNAVTRPLHGLGAQITVAGRRLFDWEDTLRDFKTALRRKPRAAVVTHVSNVFGYELPLEQIAQLCRENAVALIVDAAQSAGARSISLRRLGAAFIAMPGHKGLQGPQGTGLLLCGDQAEPLLFGGTGSDSIRQEMPDYLPDRLEAGTVNVPGIAGLTAGLRYVQTQDADRIGYREAALAAYGARELEKLGMQVFYGPHAGAVVSFVPPMDCEELAMKLAGRGVAVRAGLHCAPLAHESAGTLETGTVRVSVGCRTQPWQIRELIKEMAALS